MSATAAALETTTPISAQGRSALRAGIVGNWVDNVHVFLPLVALAPALSHLAGPGAAASTGALVVVAMLLGRPVGGIVFGHVSDQLGRTRTTSIAITGTATCALLIAAVPTYRTLGAGTVAIILALRFLGGVFVAGEYSAAIPLAMEWSQPKRRATMSGAILSMAPIAQASIAFATAALLLVLGPERYAQVGWRIMFIAGAVFSLAMLAYYRRNVVDAPVFHRSRSFHAAILNETDSTTTAALPHKGTRTGIHEVLLGKWAKPFWQVFVLMSGLWLLTDTTVLILTSRLSSDTGLPDTEP